MLKRIGIIAGCCLALAAVAQNASVGRTAEVRGLVTVSQGNIVRTARNGSLVMDGSRIVTSSNGTVHIGLDNGCDIDLRPNQSITIDYDKDCEALIASIESLDNLAFAFLPAREVTNGVLYILGGIWILGGGGGAAGGPPGPGPGPDPDPGGGGNPVPITPE